MDIPHFYRRHAAFGKRSLLAAMLLGLWLLGATQAAQAANIVVNNLADDATAGDTACTLREAILNANADSTAGDCTGGRAKTPLLLPRIWAQVR